MLHRNYKILSLIAVICLFTACKSFNVLRDGTPEEKFDYAKTLFDKGEYVKVSKIMEPIYMRFRQTTRAEEADWMMSYSFYMMGSYDMSSYMLNNFAREYPASPNAEKAVFLSAQSSYKLSPNYNLDPEYTNKAVSVLQRYLDVYPDGVYVDQADSMIRHLNSKLERKQYEIAYNYYRLEEYQAAIVAFTNVLDDTPSNAYREQIMFYRFKAAYLYAHKSISDKQKERYTNAATYGRLFLRAFPNSEFRKEADEIAALVEKEMQHGSASTGKDTLEKLNKKESKAAKKESKAKKEKK